MLEKRWYRVIIFVLAIMLYIAANILDYSYTVHGITDGVSQESNFLAQHFVNLLGVKKGLQVFKTLTVGFVISCAIVLEIKYCQKKGIPPPSTLSCCILCSGAILKLLAVFIWLKLLLSSWQ